MKSHLSLLAKGWSMLTLVDFENCERTVRMSLQLTHDGLKEAPFLWSCFATGGIVKFSVLFLCSVLLHVYLYASCATFLQVDVCIYWLEFRVLCYLCILSFCQKHHWLFVMLKTPGNSPFRTTDKNSYYCCREFITCLIL